MNQPFNELVAAPVVDQQCRQGELWFDAPFALDGGGQLEQARLAWQWQGPSHAPTVLVLGGISAHRAVGDHADQRGWWREQCGLGRALDPRRLRILGIDWLGGSRASTGPNGDQAFPQVSSRDQARAIVALLDRLGLVRVPLVIGASYGGCVAQHLAVLLGPRIGRCVIIGAAHRASRYAVGLRHVQRELLQFGLRAGRGSEALALARSLALLSYRSVGEFENRFADNAALVDHLRHHGQHYAQNYDPVAAERLAASLDEHVFEPETLRCPTRIVAFDSDALVPVALLREFAARAPRAGFTLIGTRHGHDAFLKEQRAIGDLLRAELAAEGLR